MSDKRDDKPVTESGQEKTEIRGQGTAASGANKSGANNDATIVREKSPAESPATKDFPTDDALGDSAPDSANENATILRPRATPPSRPDNNDATIVRDRSLTADAASPEADETVIRGAAAAPAETSAIEKGAGNSRDDLQESDETVMREPVAPDHADSATILRSPQATVEQADDDESDATILREPGEDGATILRGASGESEDATILRAGEDEDGDRTILNDNYDDDSTVIGAGAAGQDTTYIASVGKQVRPQGNSEAGRLLKNRFVLEEKIGSGGMGDVYKALDLRQQEAQERDPYIAIKLLNENFSRHKDAFLSLQRETSRTRGIPHPNIMGVYDFDREGDTVFMSMELLEGKPLDDYLKEHPEGVSLEDAWNIIDGISKGLMRAHDAGIVHSDFKPGNIFYTSDKTAKVFDFGIARAVSNPNELEADGEKTVFDAGSLGALTPTYASYEMLKGLEPSKSDDVYAVALVAYELFMGKHPYDRVPADKAFERGLKPKPVPFLKRRHWKALRKALELKGEDRTQSIDEFTEGMFSKDPPYIRYAIVATLLLGSVGFGAYQTMNIREKPLDLVANENTIAASQATLNTLSTRRFESPVWHEQLATAMYRWQFVEQQMLENEEWVKEWDLQPSPLLEEKRKQIVDTYLTEITRLRDDAQTYDSRRQDEFGVTQALELLQTAKRHMDIVIEHYQSADPEAVDQEVERLYRRIAIRENQVKEIELAEAQAAEAEALRIAREIEDQARREFEAARLATYDGYLAEMNEILKCKGDISDPQVNRYGQLLKLMQGEWQEAYTFHYPKLTSYMATCIQQRIGFVDPERAREVQAKVVGFVPGETQISSLVIEDKDPCDERKLVGRGNRNRSWCVDNLSEGGAGPELVVIPPMTVKDHKYAISRAEVKIGEYNLYCQNAGCVQLSGNSSLPATNLTIDEARAYTRWLTGQTGQSYRLPTVKEWTHAATVANTEKTVDENINCTVDSRGVRLGEKLLNAVSGQANSYGLYNYVGNAREWAVSDDELMALGGAHTDPRQECTLDKRVVHQGDSDPVTGFRVLREIEEKDTVQNNSEIAASG